MKICYIALEPTAFSDGRSIYDKQLVDALRRLGHTIHACHVRLSSRRVLPIWMRRVAEASIQDALDAKNRADFTIISHELLADLNDYITPNVYIVHNLFTDFSFPEHRLIEYFYKLGSLNVFNKIFKGSSRVHLLSRREKRLAAKRWPNSSISSYPPGVRKFDDSVTKFDERQVKRAGSSIWLPKRVSRLSDKQINVFRSSTNCYIPETEKPDPSFAIIEDRFLSGFKLKLIESLYCGDAIASFSDLEEEIEWVQPKHSNYNKIDSIDGMIHCFNSLPSRAPTREAIRDTRSDLLDRFSWEKVASFIIDQD